jgi:MIP family channel proteins
LYSLPQKLAAEFIGTFGIVLIAAGAICAGQYLRDTAQIAPSPLASALAYGFAVAVMVSVLGHISGAHLNPAITVGCWVTRRLGTLKSIGYVIAQLLGAAAASYVLTAILPESIWRPVSLGAPSLAPDFNRLNGMALEATLTFFVVFAFFATAIDSKEPASKTAGFVVGLTVAVDALFGLPFTGAAMNPARSFGPALAAHHWQNHGVYWVGPLLGGALAAFVYDLLFLHRRHAG